MVEEHLIVSVIRVGGAALHGHSFIYSPTYETIPLPDRGRRSGTSSSVLGPLGRPHFPSERHFFNRPPHIPSDWCAQSAA